MKRQSIYLLLSAAILSGFVGAARAELIESTLPSQPKVDRPAPVARSSHAIASHRVATERTTVSFLPAEPACGSFACGQYLIVGIGF
jgi:hypothetical protein